MSRWRAAAIHLAYTLPVVALIGYLQARVWYPPPLLVATGSDRMLLLTLAGGIALGPLLTLIAFKTGKKTLRSDLIVISVLQIAALAAGAYVMFVNRPVFLVAVVDRVNLVSAAEFAAADLAAGDATYAAFGWGAPRRVGAALPSDPNERSAVLQRTLEDGSDIHVLPKYFVSYESQRAELLGHCQPIAELRKRDAGGPAVDDALAGQPEDGTCWLPLVHRKASFALLISRQDATPVGVAAIDPWQQ